MFVKSSIRWIQLYFEFTSPKAGFYKNMK